MSRFDQTRERFELRFARRMTSLPRRLVVKLAGPPIVIDGQRLNPQLQLILKMRTRMGAIGATADTPESSRSRLVRETRTFAGLPRVGGPVRDFTIPGPAGEIPVRHYHPGNVEPRPLLVFFHGGGHVIGNLDTHDQPCRIFCRHAGVQVLSVEYRKAPEDPFPAAPEDCLAAYEWARAHAAELGADPERIAVAGDSAGGNLAAVVAAITAERDEAPALQFLIYPGLERDERRPSIDHFREGFFLTEEDIDWFFRHYAGEEPPKDDPRLNPMAHDDLSILPPTIVVTAGFDPLRDEGEWYADELRALGVPVMVRRFHDLSHGILNMTGVSSDCYDAMVEMAGMLRAALDLPVGAPLTASA